MTGNFITFSEIAYALDVSSRTIIRELDDCASWLNAAGFVLERKASQGIRLAGTEEDRDRLLQLLDPESVNFVFNTPDRLLFLRQSLLRENEPVKLFALGRQLKVAESTISGDLGRLDQWFTSYGLSLVRKPGLGIYLEGTENARRQALKDLLHEVWNENSLIELMFHPEEFSAGKRHQVLLQLNKQDLDHLRNLIQILEVWEKQNQLVHREHNFLNLVLHLFVLTWRQDQPFDQQVQTDESTLNTLALANSLLEEISMTLSMPWLTREVPSLAAQLPMLYPEILDEEPAKGGRIVIDASDLARQMISLIQSETGYAIHDEDVLVDALSSHLQLAVTRLQFNQMIHNPLEKEIRDHYPQWFELARKCAGLIEQMLNKRVPDAETAYLTLYLGAAMEKAASRSERHYHIAVLCPIGMSSSVLLASRVEAIFPQVTVDAIISFKQAPEVVNQQRFDLILSTADIALPGIPVLTVRPFFPEADQEKLRAFLKTLLPRKIAEKKQDTVDLLTQLSRVNDLVSGLYSLLNHFFFIECDCKSVDEAIILAARQIQPENAAAFADALVQRESLGPVVISELQMTLLHTRTTDITDLHFGLLRLAKPLIIDGQAISTILVMAAPLAIEPVKLDIMRMISRSIIDDPQFSQSLKQDSSTEIYHQLERLIKNNFPMNLASGEVQFIH